jgi:hypothetical protein
MTSISFHIEPVTNSPGRYSCVFTTYDEAGEDFVKAWLWQNLEGADWICVSGSNISETVVRVDESDAIRIKLGFNG